MHDIEKLLELFVEKGGVDTGILDEETSQRLFNVIIESIQGLEKSESHNPRTEVNCYFSQIRKFINRNNILLLKESIINSYISWTSKNLS